MAILSAARVCYSGGAYGEKVLLEAVVVSGFIVLLASSDFICWTSVYL